MAPLAARAFSCPRRTIIPIATKIKPIWLIDEQASVRFKSIEKRAKSAPKNIVIVPRIKIKLPQGISKRKILTLMATPPKIPDFVKTPDNKLEATAGATGCAFGNQI